MVDVALGRNSYRVGIEDIPQDDTVYLDIEHADLGNRSFEPETAPVYELIDDNYAWTVYLDFPVVGHTPKQFASV